ncbi:MAG: hypothetical protein MJZ02_05405 [Paludibacteraceae bacterium]|nr:hypothetical protein [Paludibacteraceae bacterium]
MELKNLKVSELSKEEMKDKKGGFLFLVAAVGLCTVGAGVIISGYAKGVADRQKRVNAQYDRIMNGYC